VTDDPAAPVREELDGETSRDRLIALLMVAIPAIVLAVYIYLLKHDTPIWGDGARVINERLPPTARSLLKPFHAHLNAVVIALWAILPGTAAKLGAMLVTHVALATATTALLIRRLGIIVGAALGLPLALLGSAHFDLLMPWQILFMIPLLLGLVAILASEPRDRTWVLRAIVAVSIGVAVASSNVGLFIGFALGLWFVLERRWTQILELMPAAIGWGLWFLRFGSNGVRETDFPPTLAAIPYTIYGFAAGVGGVAGVGRYGGLVLIAVGLAYALYRRISIPTPVIAVSAALVVMFVVLSGFRSASGVTGSVGSRYVYITAYFLAFALIMAAPRLPRTRWWLVASAIATSLNVVIFFNMLPTYP
jgi:hypothetical protein